MVASVNPPIFILIAPCVSKRMRAAGMEGVIRWLAPKEMLIFFTLTSATTIRSPL